MVHRVGIGAGESRFGFPYQTRTSVGRAIGDFLSLQLMTNFCRLEPQLRSYLVRRLDGVHLKDGICEWQVLLSTNSNYELIS